MPQRLIPTVLLIAGSSLWNGCLPSNLDKYRSGGAARLGGEALGPDPLLPATGPLPAEPAPPAGGVAKRPERSAASRRGGASTERGEAPPRATIYALDQRTFRFALKEADIWDALLEVLLRNYNLTIVDRQSGIVSTEWDTYYLGNAVYRNKLSLRIRSGQRNATDLTIHNAVERLRDAAQAAGTVGAVWLPAEDPASEVRRIVQNLAILLGQPPPVMPPGGAIAKGEDAGGEAKR